MAFNKDPTQTYKQGVNKFTDLSKDEFKNSIKGYAKNMKGSKEQAFLRSLEKTDYESPSKEQMEALPESWDWRT